MKEAKIPGKTLVWLQVTNGTTKPGEPAHHYADCRHRSGYLKQGDGKYVHYAEEKIRV